MHAPNDDFGLTPRFWVQRELGRGAASRVLEVWDPIQDVRRALKLATTRRQLRRYQLEYRLLTELRHPNIVRAYDYGLSMTGLPYYSLELIDGGHFGPAAHGRDPTALGVMAMQVLEALATLHARGWVHRDIKPKNLLVVGKGPAALVRLIDFGLVAPAGKRARSAGTLPYIAPEVARGAVIDGRADLYALGALLYEALLPEESARTLEEVARRYVEKPVAPAVIDPLVPRGLSDFVMRLLEPDPDARYPHAAAAADALARMGGLQLGRPPARASAERMLRGGAVAHRPRPMKRLEQLAEAVRAESRGRVCVLEGEIGVGKTPFLRELGVRLCLAGFRVAQFRTATDPGAPIGRLLRAAHGLAPDVVAGITPLALPWEARPEARGAFTGKIGAVLARAFVGSPTALLIDDLHRAEQVALEVLRDFGEAIGDLPLLLVCSGDPRADGVALRDALGEVEVVDILPLKAGEAAKLAAHRLAGLEVPKPAVDRLVKDTGGMPSLIERTLARLLVEGTIERSGPLFSFSGGRYFAARHSDVEQLADRVAEVKDEQRTILWAGAVLAHRLDPLGVAHVAGETAERATAVLAELARIEILAPGEASHGAVYMFARRHLQQVVYQMIPPEVRRAFHDRAAELYAGAGRPGQRAEERVEHLLKGSSDARAVEAAVAAGDRAAAVYADRRAIEYYARAYARCDVAGDAAAIALRLGRLFERTGELERAATWYEAALDAPAPAEASQLEAALGLATVSLLRGLPAETERWSERAAALAAGAAEPQLRAAALRLQARVALHKSELARAARLLREALDALAPIIAQREQAPLAGRQVLVDVLLEQARLAQRRGQLLEAVRCARRALHGARALGDPSAMAEASNMLARGFSRAGRTRAARRALLEGLRGVRASGDRLREGLVLRELAHVRLREGDLDAALERYGRALELLRVARARTLESACLTDVGAVCTLRGDLRGALSALAAAVEVADTSGDVRASVYALVRFGQAQLAVGDYGAARVALHGALAMPVVSDDPSVRAQAQATSALLAALARDTAEASRLLAELPAVAEALEDPSDRASVHLYATRAALELGRIDEAEVSASRARELVEQGGVEHLRAEVDLEQARVALARGDAGGALRPLRDAVSVAASRGLRPTEVAARFELGRALAGSDVAAEELTHAMELLREVARALPAELSRALLATPLARALKGAFAEERARLRAGRLDNLGSFP